MRIHQSTIQLVTNAYHGNVIVGTTFGAGCASDAGCGVDVDEPRWLGCVQSLRSARSCRPIFAMHTSMVKSQPPNCEPLRWNRGSPHELQRRLVRSHRNACTSRYRSPSHDVHLIRRSSTRNSSNAVFCRDRDQPGACFGNRPAHRVVTGLIDVIPKIALSRIGKIKS